MDIVTLVLAKNYTNTKISEVASGFHYKGAVNYQDLLPTSGQTAGDIYTVKYRGTSTAAGTEAWGAEFVWGTYEGTAQWIELGSQGYTVTLDI